MDFRENSMRNDNVGHDELKNDRETTRGTPLAAKRNDEVGLGAGGAFSQILAGRHPHLQAQHSRGQIHRDGADRGPTPQTSFGRQGAVAERGPAGWTFPGNHPPYSFITVIDWLYTVPLSFLCFIHSFQVPFYRVIGC